MKSYLGVITAIAATTGAVSVSAELKVGFEPPYGVERTATVGTAVTERYRYEVKREIHVDRDAVAKGAFRKIRLPAEYALLPISSSAKFKACVEYEGRPQGACGFDDDGDGKFDRIADDIVASAVKLDEPAPYSVREVVDPAVPSFRQVITYMGATADTLRLSYREFSNDTARPAFTEELSLPLGKSFPQQVAFKDVRMTILGIDGMGLRYRIER